MATAKRKSPKRSKTPASLKTYRAKRDFTKSPEPTGSSATRKTKPAKTLFFCVQKHLASRLHYDFRLENAGVLLSWAVPKGPSLNPEDKRLAMKVEDHPFDYGEFEGVIPSGYGAGIVMLWDKGAWTPDPATPNVAAAIKKGELKFSLEGVKLKGSWVLVRTRDERTWLLIKHRDDWAGNVDITTLAPKSVKSDQDFEHILAADTPAVWQSHDPDAPTSAPNKQLQQVLEKAAKLKSRAKKR